MQRRRRRGLSLIEIIVVIAIISLLMGAVGVYAVGLLRESKIKVARQEIHALEAALDAYLSQVGRYPSAQEQFRPLIERRILKKKPLDPWGNDFLYALVNGAPVLRSLGADGVEGGTEDGADLSNER